MRKKKITQISAIAMAMAMAVTPTANVFAYGETSGNSTLFSDTQKVSDYSTWKDSVDISHILGNLITVIFDYQILRKPLKILSL